jgi:radical SAM protein with 4Fe4S-binding SPASM domain
MGRPGRGGPAHAVAAQCPQEPFKDRCLGGGSVRRRYCCGRELLGQHTTLDPARSSDPATYLNTDEVPCPFIFERLNIDSRGNVMVCGYDISANTSMGNVNTESIRDIWHGEGFRFYRDKHLAGRGKDIALCAGCPDWKYRSWQHNYWKVVKNAEAARERKLTPLGEHDDLGVAETGARG